MNSHGTHAQIVAHIKAATYDTLDLSLPITALKVLGPRNYCSKKLLHVFFFKKTAYFLIFMN